MDIKNLKILFTEEQIQSRIKELAEEMNKFYKGEEVYAVCVLKGAVMFATDLIKHLNMPLKMEFIRLSSYNGSTQTSIEDIVDTGLTAKFLLDFMNCNFHTKSTKFCSLLDKKITRVTDVEPDYYGFEVDDKFLIGYGLDYDGYYRNLTYIGYADKSELE